MKLSQWLFEQMCLKQTLLWLCWYEMLMWAKTITRTCFKVSCQCHFVNGSLPDSMWTVLKHWTSTIRHTAKAQRSGHLQSCLHSGDSSATKRASASLVPAAVGLADTQEEHAGRQTGSQRQGTVNTDVWSTNRKGSSGRERTRPGQCCQLQELATLISTVTSYLPLNYYTFKPCSPNYILTHFTVIVKVLDYCLSLADETCF